MERGVYGCSHLSLLENSNIVFRELIEMKVYGFWERESEAKVSQYLSYLYHIVL